MITPQSAVAMDLAPRGDVLLEQRIGCEAKVGWDCGLEVDVSLLVLLLQREGRWLLLWWWWWLLVRVDLVLKLGILDWGLRLSVGSLEIRVCVTCHTVGTRLGSRSLGIFAAFDIEVACFLCFLAAGSALAA